MKKRLLAGLMAMCLVLTLLPASALAADGSTEQTGSSVAKVGELYYDSLADAVAAIDTEGTIELVKDTTLENQVSIPSGKSITINLGTYTVRPTTGFVPFQALFGNKGDLTIKGGEGAIDISANSSVSTAVENAGSGVLNVISGNIIGNARGINVKAGTANISGGSVSNVSAAGDKQDAAVYAAGGTKVAISGNAQIKGYGTAVRAYGAEVTISDNAALSGQFGVMLFNDPGDNTQSAVHASLTMTGGSIEATSGFALSGNNLQSARCSAEITGGSLQQTSGETCIYWPMEGTLTIGGNAVVEGGSGIEVRMGTVTIQDGATILGTGAYLDDTPVSGQSQADGSALLLSAEMYGSNADEQYITSPNLTVSITGGTLSSTNGNAVTVYNSEVANTQIDNDITISGTTELSAGSGTVVKVITTGGNETEASNGNYTTDKSVTKVEVSNTVASAAVDSEGKTSYYTDVSRAIEALDRVTEATEITVYGNTTIRTDVVLKTNITLVVTPGVTLSADVASGVNNMAVVASTDTNGNTMYKLVNITDTSAYTASITDGEGNVSYFDTLANAVKTVQDGQIITLLKTTSERTITVSRPVSFTIDPGTTTGSSYTIVAGSGYVLSVNGNTYTITAYVPPTPVDPDDDNDHGSSSSSSVRRYDIEADAGRGGDISPDGRVRVRRGENQTFRITADDGWEIADVEVDGESVGAVERYTFENVRTDHTISATFRQIVTEPEEPETPALPFTDVAEGDWYYDAVAYCWENGIMDGTSGTAFAPNMLLNRAMMAQVLYNLAGGTASTAAGFPDVAASAWYADAVNWAAANGYVTGYDNGSYGPEDNLTREQMAAILYRYAGSPAPAGSLDGFADAASASDYAVDALRWAVGEGLLTGKDGGRLDPTGTASRAELAQILARFAQM